MGLRITEENGYIHILPSISMIQSKKTIKFTITDN